MRFQIQILLTDEALKYQNKLLDIMETKFNQTRVRAHKVEPHMTIKYGFECTKTELEQLEKMLEKVLKVFGDAKYNIGGFDTFNDNGKHVLFTKVGPSAELQDAYTSFYNHLKQLKWLTWKSYDLPRNNTFHSSLASGKENDIKKISDFLIGKEKYFEQTVKKIVLYRFTKKVNNIREYTLYREFELAPK